VPGYEAMGWLGIVAPKDTPASIIEALNQAINAGLADPKIKQTMLDWGETVFATSPGGFGKFLTDEHEKWGKVIRAANIKLERCEDVGRIARRGRPLGFASLNPG